MGLAPSLPLLVQLSILSRWASHGFIVVAPLMGTESDCKNPPEDARRCTRANLRPAASPTPAQRCPSQLLHARRAQGKCSDKSSDGRFIQDGLAWLRAQNEDPNSVLHTRVDVEQIAVGGWSMGGVSAIKAVAAMPRGTVRAVVLDSPSVEGCSVFYNYTQKEIQEKWAEARRKTEGLAPWFLYTATNDILQHATLQLSEVSSSEVSSSEASPASSLMLCSGAREAGPSSCTGALSIPSTS